MSGWRVARSLEVLRAEVNALAPNRSKASDGTIGDRAHAESSSDHNPNKQGVVCALDLTHDPGHGADMHVLAEAVRRSNHPALKYIIWDRHIWSVARASEGWRRYSGSNPHTRHMHVSVGRGPDGRSTGPYDDTSPWGITHNEEDTVIGLSKGDSGAANPALKQRILALQYVLRRTGVDPGPADGEYGPKVAAAVLAVRKSQGSNAADGDNITGAAYDQILSALIDAKIAAARG